MQGLSDDRNRAKASIFASASGARCFLFIDHIRTLYFLCKKRNDSTCKFEFSVYRDRCVTWNSRNCCIVCSSCIAVSIDNKNTEFCIFCKKVEKSLDKYLEWM